MLAMLGAAAPTFWNTALLSGVDSQMRTDVAPLRQHARLRRKPRVAGEEQTGRRLREHRAADVGVETRLIELIDGAVQQLLREERLPADAGVDGDLRADAPCVLR